MVDLGAEFQFSAHGSMPAVRRQAICEWLTGLGLDPTRIQLGTVHRVDDRYRLTVNEYVTDDQGRMRQNPVAPSYALTVERVVELGSERTWPA